MNARRLNARRLLPLLALASSVAGMILLWPYIVGGTLALLSFRIMRRRAYPGNGQRRASPWLAALLLDLLLLGGVEGLRRQRARRRLAR